MAIDLDYENILWLVFAASVIVLLTIMALSFSPASEQVVELIERDFSPFATREDEQC